MQPDKVILYHLMDRGGSNIDRYNDKGVGSPFNRSKYNNLWQHV